MFVYRGLIAVITVEAATVFTKISVVITRHIDVMSISNFRISSNNLILKTISI